MHRNHPLKQHIPLIDEVIAQKNSERLLPDMHVRA
jgi:hypothetical protein